MGDCCVQKGILFLELGRTERGRIHISTEPQQGSFASEPRPPLRLGLGLAVWSVPEFDGLYSQQPRMSAPRDRSRLVRTKHGNQFKKTKSVSNRQATAWLFRFHTMEHNLRLIDKKYHAIDKILNNQ